jgi:hypothetical protein
MSQETTQAHSRPVDPTFWSLTSDHLPPVNMAIYSLYAPHRSSCGLPARLDRRAIPFNGKEMRPPRQVRL